MQDEEKKKEIYY